MTARVIPATRTSLRRALLGSLAAFSILPAFAAPGELDPTFGAAGRVRVQMGDPNVNPIYIELNAVAQQPDGKLVLAGAVQRNDIANDYSSHFLLVRLNTDGTLDTSFDSDGWTSIDFAGGLNEDKAFALLVQPDLKIVAAGYTRVNETSAMDIALARVNPDGSPDVAFGVNGRVSFDAGGQYGDVARAIVRRTDGSLVVAGASDRNGDNDLLFAALDTNGQPVTGFGTDGVTLAGFGPGSYEQATALALQTDGGLVAMGVGPGTSFNPTLVAARVTSAGVLDTSFDDDGLVVVDFSGAYVQSGSSLAVQTDGRIVLAGHAIVNTGYRPALARLNTDGSLDTTFGGTGTVTADLGADWVNQYVAGVTLQTDGRIVFGGHLENANYNRARDLYLARLLADGSLDTSFGNQGLAIADFGIPGQVAQMTAYGVLRQSDGRLVAIGQTSGAEGAVARFDSAGGGSGGVLSFQETYTSTTEDVGTVSVSVRRTGGAAGAASVSVRLGAGNGYVTAGQGCDFDGLTVQLNWADGDYADKQVNVTIVNDDYNEGQDSFELELFNAVGAALAQTNHTVVIQYDPSDTVEPVRGLVSIVPSATVNEAAGSVTLTLSRTDGSDDCAIVVYQTFDSSGQFPATAGSDYVAGSAIVQFGNGDTADKQITIPIINDAIGEADETFGVQLTGNSISSSNFAEVTIQDNDGGFPGQIYVIGSFDLNDLESAGPLGGPIVFVREGGSNGQVGVTYTVTSGTATAGSDFVATTGTVVWQSGDTTNKEVYVEILEDTLQEPNETYIVTISNPTGGAILGFNTEVTQTILDNDTLYPGELRCWAYTSSLVYEASGAQALIGVLRENGRDGPVSVDYSTTNGTATAGSDYTAASGTLNWGDQVGCAPAPGYVCSGDPLRLIAIPIADDALAEGDETFSLVLSNPTGGAALSQSSSCEITIYRSDPTAGELVITPLNQNVSELAGTVTVSVTRTGGTQGAISVDFRTIGSTATQDADFTSTNGTLAWADGEGGAKTVTVSILDDALVEFGEIFYIFFENITGGAILQNPSYYYAYIQIIDDETNPGTLELYSPVQVSESAGTATFNVARTLGTTGAVSVDYTTVPGTAQPPGDYTTTSGTLNWAAGAGGIRAVTIPITNDSVQETLESFTLQFSNVTGGAAMPETVGTVEIDDDDNPGDLAMSLATVEVSETATTLSLTVTRTTGSSGAVGVSFATSNGTATAGADYTAASGSLSWADGETTPRTISITILDDAVEETNETFAVSLSNPTGGARLQQASTTVTVLDNDANPGQLRFAVSSRDVSEAAATVQIDVERFGGGLGAVSVQYSTTQGTATAGSDYTTTSGTLNWADGDRTTHSFSIPIVNDTISEIDETFTVTLSNPTGGAVLATPSVETVTITNDDPPNGVLGLDVQSVTVTEGGSAVMQVTRTSGSGGQVQVDFSTSDVSAAAPGDYAVTTGTLTWLDGDTTPRTITVPTVDDAEDERVETFWVSLSNIQGGAFTGRTETVVSIEDNDVGPTGTIAMNATAYNYREDSTVAQVVVSRTGGFSGVATVDFTTQDFTALAGSDYTAQNGTLTWADGDTENKLISVPINNDPVDEPNEVFNVVLANATGAALDGAATTSAVTIEDDDLPLVPGVLSVGGPGSIIESAAGANYSVTRAGGADGAISVEYTTVAGTATAGGDYTTTSGTFMWADGETAARVITVPLINDALDEPNETFAFSLANPSGGATLGVASVSTTIVDDDVSGPGSLGVVASVGVFETVGTAVVTVRRSGGFDGAISVSFATTAGTAVDVDDYSAVSGTLTWEDGDGADKFISVPIVNDTVAEASESFSVTLSAPTGGATLGAASAFVTIQDDDVPGTLAFTQTAQLVDETAGSVTFAVSRSNGVRGTVTVDYATVAGSAAAGGDYTSTTGTLTWTDGDSTSRNVTVPILDDTLIEFDESFTIVLSNATGGAAIGAADTASVTIVSDEVPIPGTIRMVASSVTVEETAGTATLSVERVGGSDGAVTIDYGTVIGTATAADFTPTSGTLSWADGDTAVKTLAVTITNDTAYEEDEAFAVTLSNPQGGAILANPSTTVTIHSDDVPVPGTLALSVTSVSVNEPAGTVSLTVTRTGGSDGAVSVAYATAIGSAGAADFTATAGTLTWSNGDAANKTIVVPIADDTLFEPDEIFTVTLSGATGGATLGAAVATVTIVSEDPPQRGTLAVANASVQVGEAAGTATITVNRTGGSDGAVGVSYATAVGTADAGDFTASSGTLSWADGDAAPKSFTVPITNDAIYEPDETFTATLSNATGGATLGAATTTVTVQNDDSPLAGTIRMAVAAASVNETDGSVSLTVERVGGSDTAVSVNYATATGTAGAGDFTATSGTLNWAHGDATAQTITVPIVNDTSFEPDETLTVNLSAISGGAALGTPTTTVTIVSEDPPQPGTLAMAAATTSVAENLGVVTLRVNRTGGSDGAVSVNFASAAGTAGAADFTATSGTLNWADHDAAAKTITVPINNDTLYEANETFTVTLTGASGGATLGADTTTVTIVSEDAPQRGTIAMTGATLDINEQDGTVTIGASRTGGTDGAVAVSYTTTAGTASAADFTATSGTLNWADGESGTKTFSVAITNDAAVESTETFAATLSNPTNDASLGTASTTISILDDDILVAPGVLSLGQGAVTANETAGTVTLTVTRSNGLGGAVSVGYAAASGTATVGEDFAPASGTLTWAPGDAGSQTITLTLIDDTVVETDETFTLTLSSPTGGATLGTSVATITVLSEDIPPDTTPEQFTFDDQADLPPGAEVQSNAVTVTGINAPAAIGVSGGEYSVNGGAFTSDDGTVANGATVRVRVVASDQYSTTVSAVLTIGGVSDAFSVTTRPATTVTVVRAKSGGGSFGWLSSLLLGVLLVARRRRLGSVAATAVLACSVLLAPAARAQDSGVYVDAGFGSGHVSVNSSDVARHLESSTGASVSSVRLDDTGTSYSFRVGYAVNRLFAVEAGYYDFGELDGNVTAEVLDPGAFADALAEVFPSNVHGPSLGARFSWPFMETWALRLRAGVLWWESDVDARIVSGGSGKYHASNDGTDLIWGAAVAWQPVEHFELALEYNQAELPDAVSSVQLSLSWLTGWLSR